MKAIRGRIDLQELQFLDADERGFIKRGVQHYVIARCGTNHMATRPLSGVNMICVKLPDRKNEPRLWERKISTGFQIENNVDFEIIVHFPISFRRTPGMEVAPPLKLEFIDTSPNLFPAMVYVFPSHARRDRMCSMVFRPRLHLDPCAQNDKTPK